MARVSFRASLCHCQIRRVVGINFHLQTLICITQRPIGTAETEAGLKVHNKPVHVPLENASRALCRAGTHCLLQHCLVGQCDKQQKLQQLIRRQDRCCSGVERVLFNVTQVRKSQPAGHLHLEAFCQPQLCADRC